MADYAIAPSINLELIKIVAEPQPKEQGPEKVVLLNNAQDVPQKESFADMVEKAPETPAIPDEEKAIAEEPILRLGPTEISITEDVSVSEEQVEIDPVVGLLESDVPSVPVLEVLAHELEPEDMKLYMTADQGKTAKPAVQESAELPVIIAKPEKVTFTPGNQAEVKIDTAPKFTEIMQQAPVQEEVLKPVMPKIDPVAPQDTLIQRPLLEPVIPDQKPIVWEKPDQPQFKVEEAVKEQADLKGQTTIETDVMADSAKKPEVERLVPTQIIAEPQNVSEPQPLKHAHLALTQAAMQARVPQVMQDLVVHMKPAFALGVDDKITVQLNPPSLGKIEIELHFAKDGRVNAILMADKVETHDLLKQSPQLLKDALAGEGINTDATDLSFNLRGEDDSHENKESKGSATTGAGNMLGIDTERETVVYRQARSVDLSRRVDINA
jgi:hypothetical protein